MQKALIGLLTFLIPVFFCGIECGQAGEDAKERFVQAERYVAKGEIDFAFMEYRALLRETPSDPAARDAAFAVGEYYFRQRNIQEARDTFEALSESSLEDIAGLLAHVHLLLCARLLEDTASASSLESRLKAFLSSRKFFLAFEEGRVQEWASPLGNRYELREFVDRMEMTCNGSPFYTITLP